jgi:hypothetical protein
VEAATAYECRTSSLRRRAPRATQLGGHFVTTRPAALLTRDPTAAQQAASQRNSAGWVFLCLGPGSVGLCWPLMAPADAG